MNITDEISLRPLQVEDAQDMYDTIDAQREYLGRWLPFVDITDSVVVTQAFVDSTLNAKDKTFTIRKGGQFIGLIGFKATDKANYKTEIGYWLSQYYQGRGIMNRAVECLCKYAFEELGMNRVQLEIVPAATYPSDLGLSLRV